jgi:hypothetical protein
MRTACDGLSVSCDYYHVAKPKKSLRGEYTWKSILRGLKRRFEVPIQSNPDPLFYLVEKGVGMSDFTS